MFLPTVACSYVLNTIYLTSRNKDCLKYFPLACTASVCFGYFCLFVSVLVCLFHVGMSGHSRGKHPRLTGKELQAVGFAALWHGGELIFSQDVFSIGLVSFSRKESFSFLSIREEKREYCGLTVLYADFHLKPSYFHIIYYLSVHSAQLFSNPDLFSTLLG